MGNRKVQNEGPRQTIWSTYQWDTMGLERAFLIFDPLCSRLWNKCSGWMPVTCHSIARSISSVPAQSSLKPFLIDKIDPCQ